MILLLALKKYNNFRNHISVTTRQREEKPEAGQSTRILKKFKKSKDFFTRSITKDHSVKSTGCHTKQTGAEGESLKYCVAD